jgi:hypothetical protein
MMIISRHYVQAGLFFLKHAEEMGKEIPARELHEILLLSLQWLSGTMTKSSPYAPFFVQACSCRSQSYHLLTD